MAITDTDLDVDPDMEGRLYFPVGSSPSTDESPVPSHGGREPFPGFPNPIKIYRDVMEERRNTLAGDRWFDNDGDQEYYDDSSDLEGVQPHLPDDGDALPMSTTAKATGFGIAATAAGLVVFSVAGGWVLLAGMAGTAVAGAGVVKARQRRGSGSPRTKGARPPRVPRTSRARGGVPGSTAGDKAGRRRPTGGAAGARSAAKASKRAAAHAAKGRKTAAAAAKPKSGAAGRAAVIGLPKPVGKSKSAKATAARGRKVARAAAGKGRSPFTGITIPTVGKNRPTAPKATKPPKANKGSSTKPTKTPKPVTPRKARAGQRTGRSASAPFSQPRSPAAIRRGVRGGTKPKTQSRTQQARQANSYRRGGHRRHARVFDYVRDVRDGLLIGASALGSQAVARFARRFHHRMVVRARARRAYNPQAFRRWLRHKTHRVSRRVRRTWRSIVRWLPHAVWAPPVDNDQAIPAPVATPSPARRPDRVHRTGDARSPGETATEEPAHTQPPEPRRARPGRRPVTASAPNTQGVDMSQLHPVQQSYLEGAQTYIRGFKPSNIPDLVRYFGSQPQAMSITAGYFTHLASHLSKRFPTAAALAPHLHNIATMHSALADKAQQLYRGYRQLHQGDLNRFENPRPNETLADLVAQNGQIYHLQNGLPMHEIHALMLQFASVAFRDYWPPNYDKDAVADLRRWIYGLPSLWFEVAQAHQAFSQCLVAEYPVEVGMISYYRQLAAGYYAAADQAGEIITADMNANAHDNRRRDAPRNNEQWADVGHKG